MYVYIFRSTKIVGRRRLNRGQIDSSRESVTLQRLPNGVRLTPFERNQLYRHNLARMKEL